MAKVMGKRKIELEEGDCSNKPKFSVLMANYNNGKYVASAIQSVLNQTFRDWELVIVDDCSTDNSLEIIKSYLKDKRIKLFKNKVNFGLIGTLKRLVYKSTSDILGVLDSDDVLFKDALDVMYDAHKKNSDCGFIYSQYMICDADLKPVRVGDCKQIPPGEIDLRWDSTSHFKTFKKKCYFRTEGYDEEILYAEDKDLILKMEEVTRLLFVDNILYKYRFLPHSQSNDPIKRQIGLISHVLAKYKAYRRRLNTNNPNLTKREMSTELFYAASLCVSQRELDKATSFLSRAIKLDPTNLEGLLLGLRVYIGSLFEVNKKK